MQFNITFKTIFEYVLKKLVLCIQIRFVSTEKTTRIASRASCCGTISHSCSIFVVYMWYICDIFVIYLWHFLLWDNRIDVVIKHNLWSKIISAILGKIVIYTTINNDII